MCTTDKLKEKYKLESPPLPVEAAPTSSLNLAELRGLAGLLARVFSDFSSVPHLPQTLPEPPHYYNAIVRNLDKKVIARTFLSKLGHAPDWSSILYHGEEVLCSSNADEIHVLSNPSKPMVITVENPPPEKSVKVEIKTLKGETFLFSMEATDLIETFREVIKRKTRIPPNQQRLIFAGRQLEDGRSLAECGIKCDQTTLHLIRRLLGGAPTLSIDNITGDCVTGQGTLAEPSQLWHSYQEGLNIIGRCDNPSCVARRGWFGKDRAILKAGYTSTLILTPETALRCCACEDSTSRYKFLASNFLVAGCRAEFRFKEEGSRVVEDRVIESGSFPEFSMFSNEGEKVPYAKIEISVAPFGKSLRFCADCGQGLGRQVDEIKVGCGLHIFHKECLKKYADIIDARKNCPVCSVQFVHEENLKLFVQDSISL